MCLEDLATWAVNVLGRYKLVVVLADKAVADAALSDTPEDLGFQCPEVCCGL
jgi:hypothetical protein